MMISHSVFFCAWEKIYGYRLKMHWMQAWILELPRLIVKENSYRSNPVKGARAIPPQKISSTQKQEIEVKSGRPYCRRQVWSVFLGEEEGEGE
jgi:hypothetical protein